MKNKINIKDGYLEVLYKNKSIKIDTVDIDKVSDCSWHIDNKGYARNWKHERMHHRIIGKINDFVVDHINGNKLDNRHKNLRHVDKSQNQLNRHKITNINGVTGIYLEKKTNTYILTVGWKGKRIYLGRYKILKEAEKIRREFIAGLL